MTKKALLDACTIFGMPIKDTLFTAAFQGVFQLYLSEEILDEVSRNRREIMFLGFILQPKLQIFSRPVVND
jgi:hypothetical protein